MERVYDNDDNWTGKWELTTSREHGMALCVLNVAVNHYNAGFARFPGSELDVALIAEDWSTPASVSIDRGWAIRYYRVILEDDVFTYRESDDTYGLSENWVTAWTYLQNRAFDIHGLTANVLQQIKAAQVKYPDTQYTPKVVMAVAQLVIAGTALQTAANSLLEALGEQDGDDD
jgi:hypothetical protein